MVSASLNTERWLWHLAVGQFAAKSIKRKKMSVWAGADAFFLFISLLVSSPGFLCSSQVERRTRD